jgi:hypothetical protein
MLRDKRLADTRSGFTFWRSDPDGSAKLLKSIIKPVIQRHPDLVFFDTNLFFQPIGWYLRGCMFGRSGWSGGAKFVFVYRFVIPLFERRMRGMIGWGDVYARGLATKCGI